MFQTEELQEKWTPLLDYEGLEEIKKIKQIDANFIIP